MPTNIVPNPPGYPAGPSVTNDIESISLFLNSPPYVRRELEAMTLNKFLTPFIFGKGPDTNSGAVLYDQVVANDTYLDRPVQEIAPGGEFPLLTDSKPTPKVAKVAKYGGRIEIFEETVRRSGYNVVQRLFNKLSNTIVRQVDTVALRQFNTTINPALLTFGFTTTFAAASTSYAITDQLFAAQLVSINLNMGYNPQTLLLNPTQAIRLKSLAVRDKLLGETNQLGLVASEAQTFIGNIAGLDVISTIAQPVGTGTLIDRTMVGEISDEKPLNTLSYRWEPTESWLVQGSRSFATYITDPKAAVLLTGL